MTDDLMKRVKDLDLFSLLIFRHIYESGQANEVARTLGVSASKVSRSLNSLRAAFNNDLFYRRQQGLKPTLFSEKLYPTICTFTDSLDQFQDLLLNEHNQQDEITLKLGVVQGYMRTIAHRLSKPEVRNSIGKIQLSTWGVNSVNCLHKGELDFGVTFESTDYHELTQEKIASTGALCIVANCLHPIWKESNGIKLDNLSKYPFVYISTKGFNDRIDPFEQYCRETEKHLQSITPVKSYEELHSHMLTMDSISFADISALELTNKMPGLRAERMADDQFKHLDNSLKTPRVLFIERKKSLRRYNDKTRTILIKELKDIFDAN